MNVTTLHQRISPDAPQGRDHPPADVGRHFALQELHRLAQERAEAYQEALARLAAHQAATAGPRPVGMPPRTVSGPDAEYLRAAIKTAEDITARLRASPGFVLQD